MSILGCFAGVVSPARNVGIIHFMAQSVQHHSEDLLADAKAKLRKLVQELERQRADVQLFGRGLPGVRFAGERLDVGTQLYVNAISAAHHVIRELDSRSSSSL